MALPASNYDIETASDSAAESRTSGHPRFAGCYLHLSPDAVLAVDSRGRVRAANTLAAVLLGYDQDELTGLTVEQLIPKRFQAVHAAHRDAYRQAPGIGGWVRG